MAIANELRQLIDYHNCRIFVRDGEELPPIAFQGELDRAGPDQTRRSSAAASARASPAGSSRPGESLLPRRRARRASSRSRSRARRRSTSRSSPCRCNYGARVDRRDRRLEARPQPVRRRRPAAARGARRPRGRRARERQPLRGAATRGRERQGAARVRPRACRRGGPRRTCSTRIVEGAAQLMGAPRCLALAAGVAGGDVVGAGTQSATSSARWIVGRRFAAD